MDDAVIGWGTLPLPAIELAPDGQALRSNDALSLLTGLAPEQLVGTGWFAALPPDRRLALFTALAARADFALDIRLLRDDGSKAWVGLNARWQAEREVFVCLLHDDTAPLNALQDARAELARFRQMADNLPVLIAYYERDGFTCQYANQQYATTFGFDVRNIVGKTFAQIIGEDVARQIQPNVEEVLRGARTSSYERQLPGADGSQRWIEVSLVPHRQGDGPVMGAFVLINDITRHRAAEAAVRDSEERMAKFMNASVEGIAFHKDGYITDVNAPIAALIGVPAETLRGRHVFEFVAPAQQARVGQVMAKGQELSYETEIVDAHGRVIPVEFIVRTLQRGDDKLRMTVVRDLRDRHATQASMRRLAHQDSLTQLDNRGSFMQRLEAALAVHRRGVLALYFIDLDHFKRINDSLGHVAGDALLRSVANRVVALLPPDAAAGRFGGDEFVVMVPGLADREAARDWAERLRAGVCGPVAFEGRSIAVTSTIGVALYPADGVDADHLLRHADAALYGGKAAGRDTVCFFEPAMGEAIAGGMQLEARLGDALARGEFELLLQPRVDAVTGRVAAVQGLVRWRHPQRGLLAPADFADVPGPRRVLRPVTDWALREAARLVRSDVMKGLPIVLDLASLHPHGMALSAMVGQIFAAPPIVPGALCLGLNERLSTDEAPVLRRLLAQLAELGVPAWFEGFGAGAVSLAAMRDLALAGLSLDRRLVLALPGDPGAAVVARAALLLAHGRGIAACAVGVENAAQRDWLVAEGCQLQQGPFIAPVMRADECAAWLAERAGAGSLDPSLAR